ncbi:hypothetical protein Dform_01280 [Dehalogenimonas formicexedens]|uniref:Uncharacterized protein n=1 Tax=Dehalogenimonas formicexedens TaxID=1839801 RepID=A0A1P8F833_9CHLR|nr:hypothetical protein Dform_01280 [Dehalogenimonas formicexedens]
MAKTQGDKKIVYVHGYTKYVNGQKVIVPPFYRSTPN